MIILHKKLDTTGERVMNFYLKKYQGRVPNTKISLDQPVVIQTLLGNIKNHSSREKSKPLESFNSLYFWDLGKQASEKIKIGDVLYIVTQNEVYWGHIQVHINDDEGGIGDAIGWSRQYKNPWENPIGIAGIKKLVINSKIQNILNDSIAVGTKIAKRFFQLQSEIDFKKGSDKNSMSNIQAQSDSSGTDVSTYQNELRNPNIGTISVKEATQTEHKNDSLINDVSLLNLQSQLKLLKSFPHHSERQHESLVQNFFEYLGYQWPTDIQYRIGHVDILINGESRNSMIVEVKRDWELNRNSKEVINQAFTYAINLGSRFVVITNGDYYAFFDRLRGLSISENFDFEFRLSEVKDREIQLLKKYRKSSLE